MFNDELFNPPDGITMPPGYRFVSDGESEDMNDMFVSMILAMVLAVSFIFFVLAAQFESYIDPFAIMLSLPLAMIGIIMLMGLVTKKCHFINFPRVKCSNGRT